MTFDVKTKDESGKFQLRASVKAPDYFTAAEKASAANGVAKAIRLRKRGVKSWRRFTVAAGMVGY